MIQRNKFIYLRYVTVEQPGPVPTPPDLNALLPPDPNTGEQDDKYANKDDPNYKADFTKYREDKRRWDNAGKNPVEQVESIINTTKIFASSIGYTINLGNAEVDGLNGADLVNWYMKPVSINIKGNSLTTPNIILDADNIVPQLYRKLKQKLSEQNYNYFNKPQFMLYIENGVQGLDVFKGIITKFSFREDAKIPDKFDFDLDFTGKIGEQSVLEKASMSLLADLKTNAVKIAKIGATGAITQGKISI